VSLTLRQNPRLTPRVSVELPRPSALRARLMHFPFENWIQGTKVF
jgi:hypothetical protein